MAREADKLAGAGSFLDKMRKRREMVESGEIVDAEEPKPNRDDKRGYTKENWEENNS